MRAEVLERIVVSGAAGGSDDGRLDRNSIESILHLCFFDRAEIVPLT